MLLRFPIEAETPDTSRPPVILWWADYNTGRLLPPPAVEDMSGKGLWGYWWDAEIQEAEGWAYFGDTAPRPFMRIMATKESSRIVAGGLSTGWGAVNVTPG